MSQNPLKEHYITLPLSVVDVDTPLTPPLTDKKAFTKALRVIAPFKYIKARRYTLSITRRYSSSLR